MSDSKAQSLTQKSPEADSRGKQSASRAQSRTQGSQPWIKGDAAYSISAMRPAAASVNAPTATPLAELFAAAAGAGDAAGASLLATSGAALAVALAAAGAVALAAAGFSAATGAASLGAASLGAASAAAGAASLGAASAVGAGEASLGAASAGAAASAAGAAGAVALAAAAAAGAAAALVSVLAVEVLGSSTYEEEGGEEGETVSNQRTNTHAVCVATKKTQTTLGITATGPQPPRGPQSHPPWRLSSLANASSTGAAAFLARPASSPVWPHHETNTTPNLKSYAWW